MSLLQDDSLGAIGIPISMAPSEMKRLRFHLDRVASLGGEMPSGAWPENRYDVIIDSQGGFRTPDV